jgi:hypothetical protein
MRGLSKRSRFTNFKRTGRGIVASIAVIGAAGVGGLLAGITVRSGFSSAPSTVVAATIAEIAPSDIVNLRFPADWAEPTAAEPAAPRMLAFAGDDGSFTLFSPKPIYPIADAGPAEAPPRLRSAAQAAPTQATAPAQVAPAKMMALASVSSKPVNVAPKSATRTNAVLNDSQIASIKRRLNLTPDQERYWPAVEAELRKMEYKKDKNQGTRMAAIDVSKVDVEGLKSAGFPLVMSFSDDQKRELKSLAHLLGLEDVMSGI